MYLSFLVEDVSAPENVMRFNKVVNTLQIAKDMINEHVKEGDIVLDCTVGNGNDTISLAKLVGQTGKVYGFDIQKKAIDITLEQLTCENINNRVILIEDGHENIDLYIQEKLDFIIYNLGYLPKGDKRIKTNKDTTLISLKKSLNLLNNNGIILITCYIGHDGGLDEKKLVEQLLSNLDQKIYNVIKYEFINQKNFPPILYGVEKSNI